MPGTGFLDRVRGLRAAAKVGVAATAAALTMTAAVAAAVVLPSGGGDSGSGVLQSATVQGGAPVDAGTPATAAPAADVQADAEASVPKPTGPAPSTVNARAAGAAAVTTPSTPLPSIPLPSIPTSLPIPGGVLPDLSTLTDIPTKVMDCLAPVFALVSSMPAVPSPQQLMQLGPSIVSCVTGIVADLPLPSGMNACISEIMGFVSNVTSNPPSGIPDFGGLDIAACIPSGLPVPTGSSFMGGGFPFGR